MSQLFLRGCPALALFAVIAVLASGCGQTENTTKTASVSKEEPKEKAVPKGDGKKAEDDHSGWWCNEHGLPEEVCDLCSKKYREKEKAKGNWCEHNRVKSSCYKCNPGLKEKYAAEYKAKFGKEPPAAEDEGK